MSKNASNSLVRLRTALCQAYGWQLADGEDSIDLQLPEGLPVSVSLSPDGHDLVFYSALQEMVMPSQVVLLATALSLNLHQEATRGGAIGLDSQAGALVYSWRMPADTELEQVLAALDGFCTTALELAAQLQDELQTWAERDLQRLERAAAGLSDPGELTENRLDSDPVPESVPMIKV
jgi:hypothetical protein